MEVAAAAWTSHDDAVAVAASIRQHSVYAGSHDWALRMIFVPGSAFLYGYCCCWRYAVAQPDCGGVAAAAAAAWTVVADYVHSSSMVVVEIPCFVSMSMDPNKRSFHLA